MLQKFYLFLVFLVLASQLKSQMIFTKHYSVEEGLQNERLIDLKITSKNELIILSETGLSIFDGSVFHNYTDSTLNTTGELFGVALDRKDNVYIVQAEKNKVVLKQFINGDFDTLQAPQLPTNSRISRVFLTVSTYENEEYFLLIADNYLFYKRIKDDEWNSFEIPNLLKAKNRIINKAEIYGNTICVLTRSGLFVAPFEAPKDIKYVAKFDLMVVVPDMCLSKDKDLLYLSVGNSLLSWNGSKIDTIQSVGPEPKSAENPYSINHHNKVVLDKYGNVCLVLKTGFYYMVPGPFGPFVHINVGLRWSAMYNSAAFTATNGLFVATKRGLFYSERPELYSLRYAEGPVEAESATLIALDNGTVFSGSNLTYSFIRSQEVSSYYIIADINTTMTRSTRILDAFYLNNTVYVAADEFGFGKIENEKKITWIPNNYNALLKSFAFDGKNRYAVSVNGFYKLVGERIVRVLPLSHFARKLVYVPEMETFVVCGIDNLVLIKDEKIVWQKKSNHFLLNSFSAAYYQNKLLIGGMGGLYTIENDSIVSYKLQGKTFNHNVYSLLVDSDGILWAGTDHGLFAIQGENIVQYSARNGLNGDECNRSALIQIGNSIWNGSNLGLNIVNKELLNFHFPKPAINVAGLKKMTGGSIDLGEDVYLDANENHFEIFFNALAFNTELIEFEYVLEGFQSAPTRIMGNGRMVVSYTDLPSGSYTFKVRGKYSNSDWGAWQTSSQITIQGVFYKSKWFAILVMLVAIYLIWLLFSLFNQRRVTIKLKKLLDREKQRIQLSEKRFETLFNSASSPIAVITESGVVRETNLAFQTLFKKIDFSKRDININILDHYYLMEGLELQNILKDVGKEKSLKVYIDSAPNFFTLSVEKLTEVEEENGQFQYLLILFDITERKNYERELLINTSKAEEANRLKSSFLANMSHEIRTPLNGILGISQIIEDEYGHDEGLKEYLELIKESGDRLLNTINSVLDISKIEANKFELFFEEYDVLTVVGSIVKSMQPMAIRKSLELKLTSTERVVALVDKKALQTIITNLVGNAIKYTEKGHIEVMVHKAEGGKKFQITVKDTGIGISEEFIPHLFGIFEQESTGYGRKFEGTGLGLSITKKMIELLQGEIKVDSKKGHGSTFSVLLPIQPKITNE